MGRAKIARLAHAAVGSVLPESGGNEYGGGHIAASFATTCSPVLFIRMSICPFFLFLI